MLMLDRWFAGNKNYTVGCTLYDTYGTNTALKNVLARGESHYSRQLLEEALQAINANPPQPVVNKEIEVFKPMPKGTDTMLQALEEEWKPLYQLMNLKRHQMQAFGEDNSTETRAKCHELANDILALEKQCNQIWARRDYYQANGRLPNNEVKEIVIPTEPLQLVKFIDTCKRQLRRYKKSQFTNAEHAQIFANNLLKYKMATGEDYK